MNSEVITVKARVEAPALGLWMLWTTEEHIKQWHFATSDWYVATVTIDLKEGGTFEYEMAASDDSEGFTLEGTFEEVDEPDSLSYSLKDDRKVQIKFKSDGGFTNLVLMFDPEMDNEREAQRRDWQSILNNFKDYAEKQLVDDYEDERTSGYRRLSSADDYDN